MIKGFNKENCNRRNRITAARGKVETASIRFMVSEEEMAGQMVDQWGSIPKEDSDALDIINRNLPANASPLTLDDVYIHRIEAASNSLIPDRHAFFSTSTLTNIARGGQSGVAFMNSHRTGSISSPGEMPFGRTFAGRYEARVGDHGTITERALLGFYMLKGIKPNGDSGPSTDDLHAMIEGGSLFDVSVGLMPGKEGRALCDVCGMNYSECDHVAGTTRDMTTEEMDAQKSRGIATGKATYTIDNYELSEVSGVYDGAVPGAGFSKGFSMLDQFSDEERAQFRAAFRELMGDEDNTISASGGSTGPKGAGKSSGMEGKKNMKEQFIRALASLGLGKMVASVAMGTSDQPEAIAQLMASQIENEVADRVAAHPLIAACSAAGIQTAADVNALVASKAIAERYAADVREDAKKEAIRAFGPTVGAQLNLEVETLSLGIVEQFRNSWRTQADAKFGTSPSEPARRQTAPTGMTSADVVTSTSETSAWSQLSDNQRKIGIQMGMDTDAKRENFALEYLNKEAA